MKAEYIGYLRRAYRVREAGALAAMPHLSADARRRGLESVIGRLPEWPD